MRTQPVRHQVGEPDCNFCGCPNSSAKHSPNTQGTCVTCGKIGV